MFEIRLQSLHGMSALRKLLKLLSISNNIDWSYLNFFTVASHLLCLNTLPSLCRSILQFYTHLKIGGCNIRMEGCCNINMGVKWESIQDLMGAYFSTKIWNV